MPKRPREMEKEILDDGWIFKSQEGSHRHYVNPTKSGKVTIPFHSKELSKIVEKSVLDHYSPKNQGEYPPLNT